MSINGSVTLDINDVIDKFDTISGVVYKNESYDEDSECNHGNPYAYKAAFTGADCWVCDALPLDEDLQAFEGYECPVPINTDSFGDPIDYDGE